MANPGYNDVVSEDDFLQGATERATKNHQKGGEDMVMLNARVPKELRTRLKWAALKHDRSNTSIIVEALETWLDEAERHGPTDGFEDDGSL